MPRLMPSLTAAITGVGSAYLSKMDADKRPGATLSKQWGTYYDLGTAGLGLIADMMRLPLARETTDAISLGGMALLGQRLGRSAMSGSFGTGAANMIRGTSYVGMPMAVPPRMTQFQGGIGFAQKEASLTVF